MTQKERMEKGLLYDPGDPELLEEQFPLLERMREFNKLPETAFEEKRKYMKEVFAECGENCYIELPFYANFGGHHVHLGEAVYMNFNFTAVDDGHIYLGDHVMIGPNVTIATANHPLDPSLRAKGLQYNRDVHVGENTWIGAGSVVVPGVTIGKNTVIGAGSVVTKDIPDGVVAVGNPCRVLRTIGEHEKTYFYKEDKIDWENLTDLSYTDRNADRSEK